MENSLLFLQKHARKLVYASAILIALLTFLAYSKGGALTADVSNACGFLAFSFISMSLAVTPVRILFPAFSGNAALYMARRALGVSGFVFALLHYAVPVLASLNGNFGYFLPMLGNFGIAAGAAALALLFPVAATSFDFAVKRMGRGWFTVHKLVYLIYPLIIAHAYTIGVDFAGKGINVYSGSFLLIAAATLLLEAARVWRHFSKKNPAEKAPVPSEGKAPEGPAKAAEDGNAPGAAQR